MERLNSDKCTECGAALPQGEFAGKVRCTYCGAEYRNGRLSISGQRVNRPAQPVPPQTYQSSKAWIYIVIGVVGLSALIPLIADQFAAEPPSPAPIQTVHTPSEARRLQRELQQIEQQFADAAKPIPPKTAVSNHTDPRVKPDKPQRRRRRKPISPPAEDVPVVTKAQAEAILKPRIRACVKRHGVYHLATRIGQGSAKKRHPMPPLKILAGHYPNFVDYKRVRKFPSTPLGKCISQSLGAVRASCFSGNYISVVMYNKRVPDPLAGAPDRLNYQQAERELTKWDQAARECIRQFPEQATPGDRSAVIVTFNGVDGKVSGVQALYVKGKFKRCVEKAYRSAAVPRFRELTSKVTHEVLF